ncbi:MAG TPA: ATP-binding cassette domain-containing protein, partial [Microthrixaceae bacterium]|nr:ATP-binding cassette domain-containing protein [Microthrixaceae bacterium]
LVGLLGHATGLYDDMTALDNVRFWARAAGVDAGDAPAALERVMLPPRTWSHSVAQLSAGQRRRVSLAVLVAKRPRLWLLDEPHAGLDAEARDVLDALIAEAATAGATVLFASHELDRAVAVADRVVTLVGGMVTGSVPGGRPAPSAVEPATSARPPKERAPMEGVSTGGAS